MKVLWFSPTPSLAEDYLNSTPTNGGWIRSLQKEIEDKVELSIAFQDNRGFKTLNTSQTKYYPIIINNNKRILTKIKSRLFVGLEPKSLLVKCKEIIEEVQPDLIHIHGTENAFGLIQMFCTIPTVISIQGIVSVIDLKFFSGISYLDVLKYSSLRNLMFLRGFGRDFKLIKKKSKREKFIFKLSKNLIGRTNWDRRVSKVLSPEATYFYNNEVLKEDFYEDEWDNKLEGVLKLFTTTGADLYKGIETIIFCSNLLDASNIKYRWQIAGIDKYDEIIRITEKKIYRRKSPNLQFLGKIPDRKLKEYILNCNVYVCASHIENSPNSLCEALILGAPSIATDVGGISNFIENGKSGLLVPVGDPYSLCGAIMEMKENYDLAIRFGKQARRESLIRHDKKIIADDLLNIYCRILQNRK
jgi:glycosyltransferase involved in cell wall biosynthesis